MLRRRHRIDALLLLMALIWGTNYAIIKSTFGELDSQAFNAVRMAIASSVFLAVMAGFRATSSTPARGVMSIFRTPAALTVSDWWALAGLGVVGHFAYQYLFIGGLARTTVANGSLIIAASPVVIALVSAVIGHERVSRVHWLGVALSVAGIYLVAGRGAGVDTRGLIGDAMMVAAVCCWTAYTIGATPLMVRHSPVAVTGLSMTIGTLLYVPLTLGRVLSVDWGSVTAGTVGALVYSAVFALCVAYTIWYAAVREIGNARTSVYSNLIPLVAMMTAAVFLDESLGTRELGGAALVLTGVALTRLQPGGPAVQAQV